MAVYVDAANRRFGRMVLCHMLADSIDELLEMADNLKIGREHFQLLSHPHFDVCKSERQQAVKLGAIEVDNYGLAEVMQRYKQRLTNDPAELKKVRKTAFEAGHDVLL